MKTNNQTNFVLLFLALAIGMNGYLVYQNKKIENAERAKEKERIERILKPPSDWFVVNQISVPDHKEGEDPNVLYDRIVKEAFTGTWFVKLYNVKTPRNVACSGDGQFRYEPRISLPNKEMALKTFIGKDCGLSVGCYFGQYRNEMKIEGYPLKVVDKEIGRFCVEENEDLEDE